LIKKLKNGARQVADFPKAGNFGSATRRAAKNWLIERGGNLFRSERIKKILTLFNRMPGMIPPKWDNWLENNIIPPKKQRLKAKPGRRQLT
jgi:hypothetical protein